MQHFILIIEEVFVQGIDEGITGKKANFRLYEQYGTFVIGVTIGHYNNTRCWRGILQV